MRKKRIAINGYGRIGRAIMRAWVEYGYHKTIDIVAFNNRGELPLHAHLTKFDSIHGVFNHAVTHEKNTLIVGDHRIAHVAQPHPAQLPWKALGVDVVLECTGAFKDQASCQQHIDAGAKKVLLACPGKDDIQKTIVYGVNESSLRKEDTIISNASCTTNCLAPMVMALEESIGIVSGHMTTVHAVTNDQNLTDARHSDWRRARAATASIIPTKTGAASAIGKIIPSLKGKLYGHAVRVPVNNVSMVELVFLPKNSCDALQVNRVLENASKRTPNVLGYSTQPLVSVDYTHDPRSCIVDANLTEKAGEMIRVCAWYDNEWGFSVRMLDVAKLMCETQ